MNKNEAVVENGKELQSRKEFLTQYYNAHMRVLSANRINFNLFEQMNEDEIFARVPVQIPGKPPGKATYKNITVKDQKLQVITAIAQEYQLLTVIEELLEKEGVKISKESTAKGFVEDIDLSVATKLQKNSKAIQS